NVELYARFLCQKFGGSENNVLLCTNFGVMMQKRVRNEAITQPCATQAGGDWGLVSFSQNDIFCW
ncbi:MAG: hypothetical protein IKH69_04550, partial [Bacteroidaceae bacterium]|nr:hypothetical protein [Bacteroidaceae bacterium]